MLRIVETNSMQAIDRQATEEFGIPALKLMEQAGASLAIQALRCFDLGTHSRVVVLAGTGKNGGDGLVCARWLFRYGVKVVVVMLGSGRLAPETYDNLQRLHAENIPVKQWTDVFPVAEYEMLQTADVIIDALLGIGLSGDPREPIAGAIRAMNAATASVIAADVPSGLSADTGEPQSPAVQADLTVSFGLPKRGFFTPAAAKHLGQLIVDPIGFPRKLLNEPVEPWMFLDAAEVRSRLPCRAADAHKHRAGRVLIVGGSRQYHGAVLLAGQGAARSGAGWVSLAYPRELEACIRAQTREELCHPQAGTPQGGFHPRSLAPVLRLAAEHDAVVIGPGMGKTVGTANWVKKFLQQVKGPRAVVVDADALSALPAKPAGDGQPVRIITPHANEAGRILRQTAEQVQAERQNACEALVEKTHTVVCLKGQHTRVAAKKRSGLLVSMGTPALATAGTGDVLSGLIAALCAQQLDAYWAAAAGAFIHGLAGRLASRDFYGLGVRARDVAREIPRALQLIRSGRVRNSGWPDMADETGRIEFKTFPNQEGR